MRTLKIFAVLALFSLTQAGATGFTHNMFAAQKMLKAKKEAVTTVKPSKTPYRSVKVQPSPELSYSEELRVETKNQVLSDKLATTLSQFVTGWVVQVLRAGVSN